MSKMLRRFFILWFVLYLNAGFAQTIEQQTDSLLSLIQKESSDSIVAERYLDLSRLLWYSTPQTGIEYAHKGLQISQNLQDEFLLSNSYTTLFYAHYFFGSPLDTLLSYVKEREKFTNEVGRDQLGLYWMKAMYYSKAAQGDKEVDYWIKTLKVAQQHYQSTETPDLETGILNNLGSALVDQRKYSEALIYFQSGLKIVQGKGLRGDLNQGNGIVYFHQEKYDSAFVFFNEAYEAYEAVSDKVKMASILVFIGKYYDQKKQFERANTTYFQALDLLEKNQIRSTLTEVLQGLAEHYQKRKDYLEAIRYGELALEETLNQKTFEDLSSTYSLLENCYASLGDYQKAFELRGKHMTFTDTTRSAEELTKVEALYTEFQVEKKEAENKLLRARSTAHEKTIQIQTTTAIALLLGLLLLGSWALVIYRSNQQKRKYNKQLEATVARRTTELQQSNKELQQANYELKTFHFIASHDIKEPIRNIGNYAGLIYQKLPSELQRDFSKYFDTIKFSTTQLYTLVEDFSRYSQMSQTSDVALQIVDLNIIIDNLKRSFQNLLKERNAQILYQELPQIKSNSSLLYTILKNLIENGIKFNQSDVPSVTLRTESDEHTTAIIVQDNGIGIDQAHQEQIFELFKRLHYRQEYEGSGIGLAIVKLLTDKLGGSINIVSGKDGGSMFILKLPKSNPPL